MTFALMLMPLSHAPSMSNATQTTIIYTKTDEAPALAT
jgi:hypothetical protein